MQKLDLLTLPLMSQYKVLIFTGRANGTTLNAGFNLANIAKRSIVIKRIKLIPYYFSNAVDLDLFDGATHNTETIQANFRINRLFDSWPTSTVIDVRLNGFRLPIFENQAIPGYPLDLDVDNIYYHFPVKLIDTNPIDVRITGDVCVNIAAGTTEAPLIKVVMEVYLIKPTSIENAKDCD